MKIKIMKIVKITLLVLLAFIAIIIYLQFFSWSSYLELSENEKLKYSMSKIDIENHSMQSNDSLYSIDIDELKTLISQSNTKYHVIIIFKHFCGVEQNYFKLINELNLNEENFTVYLITPEDWIFKQKILNNTQTIDKYKKYIISAYLYDIKHIINTKNDLFILDLLNDDIELDGYESVFVLNQNIEMIFKESLNCNSIELCEESMRILQQKLNNLPTE